LRYWFIKFLPNVVKHWLRHYGYFIPRDESPDAYELSEITQLLREHDDHSST